MTIDSSSENPKATPSASSTPTPYPSPKTAAARPARAASTGVAQLRDQAKSLGVSGTSRMNKKDLQKAIRQAKGSKPPPSRSTTVDPGKPAKPPTSPADDETLPTPPIGAPQLKQLLEKVGKAMHYVGPWVVGIDPEEDPDLFKFKPDELEDLSQSGIALAQRSRMVMWVLSKFDLLMFSVAAGGYGARTAQEVGAIKDKYNDELEARGVRPATTTGDGDGVGPPQVAGEARDIPVVGSRGPVDEGATETGPDPA